MSNEVIKIEREKCNKFGELSIMNAGCRRIMQIYLLLFWSHVTFYIIGLDVPFQNIMTGSNNWAFFDFPCFNLWEFICLNLFHEKTLC